jgi:hypothetical protein
MECMPTKTLFFSLHRDHDRLNDFLVTSGTENLSTELGHLGLYLASIVQTYLLLLPCFTDGKLEFYRRE